MHGNDGVNQFLRTFNMCFLEEFHAESDGFVILVVGLGRCANRRTITCPI